MDVRRCGASRPVAFVSSPGTRLLAVVCIVATVLISGLGLMLSCRRLTGALRQPLDATMLVATGLVLALVTRTLLAAWKPITNCGPWSRYRTLVQGFLAALVFLYASVLSLPGSSPWGLAILWAVVFGGLCWSWPVAMREPSTKSPPTAETVQRPVRFEARKGSAEFRAAIAEPWWTKSSDGVVNGESMPSEVLQQVTRAKQADGTELLFGVVRGEFAPQERHRHLHVAFCPPLDAVPEFFVQQCEGPPATIRAAQVELFGARIDVRLGAPSDEPATILARFLARVAPPEKDGR